MKCYTQSGWPDTLDTEDADLKLFHNRRNELSLENNVLLLGNRVVIPFCFQSRVLDVLHSTHIGISRMKNLARQYMWWPKIDCDTEAKVKACSTCAASGPDPPPTVLHPWEWPKKPWSRVHLDYAGPFLRKIFLLIVDSHSKWIDVHITSTSTMVVTMESLQLTFSSLGLPEILVTDNGSLLTSSEFTDFVKVNGIQHVRTVPYHPTSNGLAERAIQTFKTCMKGDHYKIELLVFSSITQTTTGISPAELLMGRRLCTHLDLLVPDIGERVRKRQNLQKHSLDLHAKDQQFQENDPVMSENFSQGPPWITGKIMSKAGTATFIVEFSDGRVIR